MAITPEDRKQIAEIVAEMVGQFLNQGKAQVPSPTPAPVSSAPKLEVIGRTPAPVPSPKVDITYPMDPIYGYSGETFLILARKGKGEYSEMGNPIWKDIRQKILADSGVTYEMISGKEQKELNGYVTKLLGDRVSEIRRLDREAAKVAQSAPPQTAASVPPSTLQPERVAASAVAPAPAPKLVLPPLPGTYSMPVSTQRQEPLTVRHTAAEVPSPTPEPFKIQTIEELWPAGRGEAKKLLELCRENIKTGRSGMNTLIAWTNEESQMKRQKMATKIVLAVAKELGINIPGAI